MESTMHFAIREGDWKLCLSPASGITALSENGVGNDPLPQEAWNKALKRFGGKPTDVDLLKAPFVQLYNLASDPSETNDLADSYPDQVGRLVALLQEQVKNGRSTPGPKLENDKQVHIVNLNDRRLPSILKDFKSPKE
jgi:arylsulfatase A